MDTLEIICSDDAYSTQAQKIAHKMGVHLNQKIAKSIYRLEWSHAGAHLQILNQGNQKPISVNFHTGSADHRRKFGGGKGQMIAKAVGVSAHIKPRILDATAGLGGDAFVLATLGCHIQLQERSPIAHALLADGLVRAAQFAERTQDNALANIIQRMQLSHADSIEKPIEGIDVIYLDPMFPTRKKSAAVNKSMRAFHDLIGHDDDSDQLLTYALNQDVCRIVVKRPRIAPHLADKAPSYSLEGKSSRFDIYALKKLQAVSSAHTQTT
ncbi:class I SAM-dependent methyltransferase [Marinagarivorans algicola]|uniref:class I SAM-dependent methyltransferase n=1 Tax=Marinagarivorans algicola TaxID=1513270 RepID=UPI0006B5269D|nr:class I SAM-dependent methyltransferase [Marinagarivorans algicola]